MREFNALRNYPQNTPRIIGDRGIQERIIASYRGREFFDGERRYGYGGLKYDGRWKSVADDMMDDYRLKGGSVLQIGCEKGFLLHEFKLIDLEIKVLGIESSRYARRNAMKDVEILTNLPKLEMPYDLVICLGMVYTLNLAEGIQLIKRIEETGFNAFILLASYDSEEDLRLFKKWSLLACTILKKDEWIEVLNHAGYTGDYWFVSAHSLGLRET